MVGKYAPRGAYFIIVTNASGTRTISRGVLKNARQMRRMAHINEAIIIRAF